MAINHKDYNPDLKYGATESIETGDIVAEAVTGVKLATGIGYFSVMKETGGTTVEQSLFGTSGLGVAATITGIFASSLDRTAVNVALNAGTSSVGTVVLGGLQNDTAIAGPDANLANVQVTAGTNMFIENSADGNVMVQVAFEIG